MSLTLLQPPARPAPAPAQHRHRASPAAGGRLTLDELISGAWAALSAGAPVACPVCGGRMAPTGTGAGSCGSCSTELS
jgi:DnaJ-class molecular chaperone